MLAQLQARPGAPHSNQALPASPPTVTLPLEAPGGRLTARLSFGGGGGTVTLREVGVRDGPRAPFPALLGEKVIEGLKGGVRIARPGHSEAAGRPEDGLREEG